MKLYIAIGKEPYKVVIQGKIVEHYETSTAREDIKVLREIYGEKSFNYYEIEKENHIKDQK